MPTATRFRRWTTAVIAAAVLVLAACGAGVPRDAATASTGASAATGVSATDVFDSSYVHDVSLSFAEADYEAMIETYATTGDKVWIEAAVTVDGVTYEHAGIRLKGNSSLRGLAGNGRGGGPGGTASADAPEDLPWLIRLDEYVAGRNHNGISELVIRSNVTETSLNEAVALDLIELAGLASEDAAAVAFTVNGSDAVLRLAVENPNDEWLEENFDDAAALYKAESTGDYSYRGDDPDAYDEVFDQEAGEDNADLTPLIEFLDFINNADDASFAAQLAERLDVEAFATYLALQDLIDNFDDIDGPGNNSYLSYDTETEMFTVVAWDHNLALPAAAPSAARRLPTPPSSRPARRPVVFGAAEATAAARAEQAAPQGPTSWPSASSACPSSPPCTTKRSRISKRRSTTAGSRPRCWRHGSTSSTAAAWWTPRSWPTTPPTSPPTSRAEAAARAGASHHGENGGDAPFTSQAAPVRRRTHPTPSGCRRRPRAARRGGP
jgi:spore coat protein CotH